MATRKEPPRNFVVELSEAEAKAAIPKIERLLKEVEAFDVGRVTETSDTEAVALHARLDTTLLEVFKGESKQYYNFHVGYFTDSLWGAIRVDGDDPSVTEIRAAFKKGLGEAASKLRSVLTYLKDKITDTAANPGLSASSAFGGLDLHTDIVRASNKLFSGGHYAEAVEAACKALEGRVRQLSDESRIGADLMQFVFSEKNALLRFNSLADDHDRNEQKGMMFLFAGVMMALRNPRAHRFIDDAPHAALKMIGFVDYLYRSLDATES